MQSNIGLMSKLLVNLKWQDVCMKGSIGSSFWYVSTYIKNKKVQQVNGWTSIDYLVLGRFPEERHTE